MKKYRRMTWTDRLRIEALYNAAHSFRFIAHETGFSVSSIYTEIQHGLYPHLGAECSRRPFHYSAQIAQDYADQQATSKGTPIKLGHNYAYAEHVAREINKGHSPDIIVGSLKKSGKWTVSTQTLYRYIDRGYIPGVTNQDLLEKPTRTPRNKPLRKASRPPKGQSIERRPEEINSRRTFGHWEMDSVIGKAKGTRESLIVLTERLTRYQLIFRVANKTANSTLRALDRALSRLPKGAIKTLTVDNGSEFQNCKAMEKRGLTVYYCHPFCSCERGSNERQNRIIRRYFPKGQSLRKYTQKDCDCVADLINQMPRKIFDYETSAERFAAELEKLQNSAL